MQQPEEILIIEDEADIREGLRHLLEECGYRTRQAANGREALSLLAGPRPLPDLILLDMKMPVMGGTEFTEEFIRGYDHLVPIVIMTAAADASEKATLVGASNYLSKPFSMTALLAVLEKTLRDRRRSR